MPRRFCQAFAPRPRPRQLEAGGLSMNGALLDCQMYRRPIGKQASAALCRCFDPSGGDWEDIEPPEPDEWLDSMIDRTPDQGFKDFVASRPNIPERSRSVVYLQPIGRQEDLDAEPFPVGPWPAWAPLEAAVQRFYAPLPVRTLPAVRMDELKPRPKRRENTFGMQYHAGQVLDAMVAKGLPADAFCMLAVTMHDLYPREEWNFVYGLARLKARVGVFSFVRHDPGEGSGFGRSEAQRGAKLLHASMKTMLHEIGHMFGLKHCTWYNCLMRGSNGAGVEHQPNFLHLCPVCLRKLHWSVGFDIPQRYRGLLELYQEFEECDAFARDCAFLRQRLAAVEDLPEGATAMATRPPSRSDSRAEGRVAGPRRRTPPRMPKLNSASPSPQPVAKGAPSQLPPLRRQARSASDPLRPR